MLFLDVPLWSKNTEEVGTMVMQPLCQPFLDKEAGQERLPQSQTGERPRAAQAL